MKRFKKILVGVDLSWGDRFVSEELSAPNAEAVRQALWLAKLNSASIDFLFSLELSAKAQELISESSTDETTVLSQAKERLAVLVENAQAAGVAAESHVVVGKSWLELIRQVIRKQHDMVLVGTRHMGAIKGFFLGSTGIKLLRKCPCAVWVTQPLVDQEFDSIQFSLHMTCGRSVIWRWISAAQWPNSRTLNSTCFMPQSIPNSITCFLRAFQRSENEPFATRWKGTLKRNSAEPTCHGQPSCTSWSSHLTPPSCIASSSTKLTCS